MKKKYLVDQEQYDAAIRWIRANNSHVKDPEDTLSNLMRSIKGHKEPEIGLYSSCGGFMAIVEDIQEDDVYVGVYVDPVCWECA
jgi:hypothetical protein